MDKKYVNPFYWFSATRRKQKPCPLNALGALRDQEAFLKHHFRKLQELQNRLEFEKDQVTAQNNTEV